MIGIMRSSLATAIVPLLLSGAPLPQTPPPDSPRRVVPGEQPEVKPIYRELKPGEQRVEAQLQRIACPAGRPVTFVLKAGDRVLKYDAPRLDSVEYIAHHPGFRGPVACGGYTPAEHVYLTWKRVNGADRAVAVEFLPK